VSLFVFLDWGVTLCVFGLGCHSLCFLDWGGVTLWFFWICERDTLRVDMRFTLCVSDLMITLCVWDLMITLCVWDLMITLCVWDLVITLCVFGSGDHSLCFGYSY